MLKILRNKLQIFILGGKMMIENVKQEVKKLLNKDNFGHGMDHIDRVLNLSLRFAKKEKANI
jgi:HD superfamily phosphodiesterase